MPASRSNINTHTATKPDVCLILEGTYPYVAGGVSTWVHQIITALQDIRFTIVYIGSEKNPKAKYKYTLPPNVLSVEEIYLHEPTPASRSIPDAPAGTCVALQQLISDLMQPGLSQEEESRTLYSIAKEIMSLSSTMSFATFWNDPRTWDLVSEIYEAHAAGESFLDFYWSLRGLAEPGR